MRCSLSNWKGIQRQVEDRPVPPNVQLVLWKGGREPFRWSNLPKLTFDFRRLTREIKPDLIHAGPIQTCAFIAILSGFRPILTMSWGFDLMDDVHSNKWMGVGDTLHVETFHIFYQRCKCHTR